MRNYQSYKEVLRRGESPDGERVSRSERNETARQQVLTQELLERYMRPIARIAKAALRGATGIEVALRPPRHRSGVGLPADAIAVRTAVTPYREVLISRSLSPGRHPSVIRQV